MSARHADALAHLIYGISESGGFIQLTGEVGTGKTTLIRTVLEQLPEKAEIALVLNPQLSAREFVQVICDELGAPRPADGTLKARIDSLNEYLLAANAEDRRVVLIVDEAQTLGADLLEQVRLLTNLETPKRKLLQIILIGQPELRELLARPEMRQTAQRVTGRYHLEPLGREETAAYVRHRMRVAGSTADVFRRGGLERLYRRSRGIPRLINVIADRALLAAYSENRRDVDGRLVERAAAEVFGVRRLGGRRWPWVASLGTAALFALATTNLLRLERSFEPAAAQSGPRSASLAGSPDATAAAAAALDAVAVHDTQAAGLAARPAPAPHPDAEAAGGAASSTAPGAAAYKLWRPPTDGVLRRGMEHDGVRWLRMALAAAASEPPPATPSPLFDAALETRVRDYQREHFLAVDGVVGTRTRGALLAELGSVEAPQLTGTR